MRPVGKKPYWNPKKRIGYAPGKWPRPSFRYRFETGYIVDPQTGCWNWCRQKFPKGYGAIYFNHHLIPAHRASLLIYKKFNIKSKLYVLHRCDNKSCVNPKHLFLGTAYDNYHDSKMKNRNCAGERHGRSKLKYEQIREIRLLRRQGMTFVAIAKKFGVRHSTIMAIIKGETWKQEGIKKTLVAIKKPSF